MGSIRFADNIATPAVASVTTVTLAQSRIAVGAQQYVNLTPITLNAAVTGVNGLDTGSLAVNTLYYIHAIVNSGSLALVASTSKTAPSGFSVFKWTGFAFFTNASSQIAIIVNSTNWEWVSILPVCSWTVNTTLTGFMKRTADLMDFDICIHLSGAPNSATLTFSVPMSLSAATTSKVTSVSVSNYPAGFNSIHDDGTADYSISHIELLNATTLRPNYINSNLKTVITQAAPMTFANNDEVRIRGSIPISTWTSIL